MVCVHCGASTQVVNSRSKARSNQVWRRRQCLACKTVFTTVETADYSGVWAVRSPKGRLEPFNRDKLLLSLLRSLEHRKTALSDAGGLCDSLIGRLQPAVNAGVLETAAIRQHVLVALQRFDKAAAVHYAAFHSDN